MDALSTCQRNAYTDTRLIRSAIQTSQGFLGPRDHNNNNIILVYVP